LQTSERRASVQPARLEFALLNSQLRRDLGIVAACLRGGSKISAYWYIAMRAAIGFRSRRSLTRNLPRYATRRIVPSNAPTTVPMTVTIFKNRARRLP
jgi:hypothetical protein